MIAGQFLGGDRVKDGIVFRIAEDGLLTTTAVMKQNHAFGRFALVGHNNLVENAIRPFVVGRKNWLFAASPEGAAAIVPPFSL